jgi:site-specific recombinase XerD
MNAVNTGVVKTWMAAGWKRPNRLKQQKQMRILNTFTPGRETTVSTQNEAILEMLREGRRITQIDALQRVGCFRLAARIFDLRGKGHNIETVPVYTETGKYVASYKLNDRRKK